jgi:proteasome lid subunit RPN8/RPN11
MRLCIPRQAIDAMISHARADAPNECCGLLLGTGSIVHEVIAARNARRSPTRYEIHPADHFAAIRRARAIGQAVIGGYHSHPRGPSVPSETDAAEVNDPSLVHIIVSLERDPPVVSAFSWAGRNFVPIDLVPVA